MANRVLELQSGGEPCSKQGLLMKKGMGALYRPWKERKCLLDVDSTFGYYDDRDSLRGLITLAEAVVNLVSPESADGHQFAFEIKRGSVLESGSSSLFRSDSLLLAASSEEEAVEWCACLRVAAVLSASVSVTSTQPQQLMSIRSQTTGSVAGNLAQSSHSSRTSLELAIFTDGSKLFICVWMQL